MKKIKTYVGSDGKIHFVDSTGADSVLPFSSANVRLLNVLREKQQYSGGFTVSYVTTAKINNALIIATASRSNNCGKVGLSMSATGGSITILRQIITNDGGDGQSHGIIVGLLQNCPANSTIYISFFKC